MEKQKRSWPDLTVAHNRAICAGGAAESVLTVVALRDLAQRPAVRVRGPKAAWVLALFDQPFGPLAYLHLGRR